MWYAYLKWLILLNNLSPFQEKFTVFKKFKNVNRVISIQHMWLLVHKLDNMYP